MQLPNENVTIFIEEKTFLFRHADPDMRLWLRNRNVRSQSHISQPEPHLSASFVVLQHCSREVILGMDFLNLHGAVIDL